MKECIAESYSNPSVIDNKTDCGEDQRNKKDIEDYPLLTTLPLEAHIEMKPL